MRDWLTAAEIAAEALPDMPATESAVIRRAKAEDWGQHPSFARRRAGRGGGMEYHVSILPPLAQVAYQQRHLVIAPPAPEPVAVRSSATLSDRAAQERDARLAIINAYQRFKRDLRLGHATHLQVFTDRYNTGSISVDEWVREIVPTLSKRSLMRWQSAKRAGHADRLAHDPAQARKGTGVLDTANQGRVQAFMLALIAHQPHLTAQHVRTLCRSEFGDTVNVVSKGVETTIPMPPVRTFQHALKQLKADKRVELVKLTNPDLYRSTMAPSGVGMLRHVSEPNQLWQIDASPVDALCTDGRHSIYACIDIATRRTVWTLSKTPRASAVALLIRKAVLAWGVPECIKTDNGSDFVAQDTRRLLASLDIEVELSDAYSPEQKGHVERVIGTFQRDVGPLLPGFVGHSVADRKRIESRKSFAKRLGETEAETFGVTLSGPELQKHVDEWADLVYQHRAHAGLKGQTPFAVALASRKPIRTVPERALDLLLMPVAGSGGQRVVGKTGIRIDGYHYIAASILPGTAVFVRHDPNDMGKVYAFAQDGGSYLDEAICPELAGIHPETFVRAAKELQNELVTERTRQTRIDIKALTKGPALIERALDVARRDAPNVIALPKRQESHSTPQIAAALDAVDASNRPVRSAPMSEGAAENHRRLLADFVAPSEPSHNVTHLRVEETTAQRFARMIAIERRRERGEPVSEEEAYQLGSYQQSAEYKSRKMFLDDFGDQAPVLRT